jgi:Zn-dependent metalloprotease
MLPKQTRTAISQPAGLSSLASPEQAARHFLATYGSHFGIVQTTGLTLMRENIMKNRRSSVRFQQIYQSIPVLGGELIVHLDAAMNIIAVSSEISTDVEKVNVTSSIVTAKASEVALASVAKQYQVDSTQLSVTASPALWIYNPAIVGASETSSNSLVWRVEVTSVTTSYPIGEIIFVNAHLGTVEFSYPFIHDAKDRKVYIQDSSTSARNEGDPPTGNSDVDKAYDYSGEVYDFYFEKHGRDSINGYGMTLISRVDFPIANAYWNGSLMTYGTGFVIDDVVAHEMTHGVTDHTSDLVYANESGAINESFSDVWGELIDQTYTHSGENDTPTARWLMGEDLSIGAFRNMKNPPQFHDPDSLCSQHYYHGDGDYGGVHTNSGVNNKAAFLMTDGGTFNGYTIAALGIDKVANLYYEVQTNWLTSGANYAVLRNALPLACSNLGFSSIDCQQVQNAVDATMTRCVPYWQWKWGNGGQDKIALWFMKDSDKYIAGDLDNDGQDEILAVATNGWAHVMEYNNGSWQWRWGNNGNGEIALWHMKSTDRYFAGDFDNDGQDEVLAIATNGWVHVMEYNNGSWQWRWGNNGNSKIALWHMKSTDKYFAGDFDNDGQDEVLAIATNGWAHVMEYNDGSWQWRLGNGGNGKIALWNMKSSDKYIAGDFDDDGQDEVLAIATNGWAHVMEYNDGSWQWRWGNGGNGKIALWNMKSSDKYIAGDFDDDGQDEILAVATNGWSHVMEYNTGSWQWRWGNGGNGKIELWHMNSADRYIAGNFDTMVVKDELLAIKDPWSHVIEYQSDADHDGVTSGIEDFAPNSGDGNGDGIPDSKQLNVTSLPNVVTNDYISLETTDGCPVQNVKSKSETDAGNGQEDPIGVYPQGLLEFDIPCQTANIKLFYHGVTANSINNTIEIDGINYSISSLSYRKYGPNPPGSSTKEWYTLEPQSGFDPVLQFGTTTIASKTILTVSFKLRDSEIGDDTGVDGMIYDVGGFALTPSRKGMTWKKSETLSTSEINFVGCSNCEPYKGDTTCSTKLPILCIKKEGLPNPGIETDYNHGWTGGYIALTPPIAGSELTGIGDAKLLCEYTLGNDYRMAEFHDGNGGWGYYAYGNVDDSNRFWTYINDQNANCWWGHGAGAEPEDSALERLVEAMDCDQPNDCQHQAQAFSEVAQSYGVDEHESNLAAVWLDYNNDGDLDLITVPSWGNTIDNDVVLYRNDGNSFTDVANAVGLAGNNLKHNLSVGDYDNDGDIDLLIGARLYRNDINPDGQFTFVETPYGHAFVDYDQDGDLDIFLKGWGSPGKLSQNNDGTFTEIVGALGLNQDSRHLRSINWADYDMDGDMDVLLINGRSERPTLFRNELNTSGQFTDATSDMGLASAGSGYTEGAAWGDYDNDGDLDLYITNYSGANHLYRNDGNVFTQVTTELGVASQRGFHANWEDYDNDGDLDLYVVMLDPYPNKLYRNEISEGNGFVETGEMAETQIGYGGSWGDFDADGDLDYFLVGAINRNKATNRLYQNNASENGNHWLQLKLIGTVSNRSAIGATIYIKTGDLVQMRHIASYGNASAQNTFPVAFGLGEHATVDTITIKWPNGIEQVLENVAVDQLLTIEEPFTSTIGLTVTKTGEGKISSADNTINCGETCQANYEVDSTVTLTATPATGSTFTGWSGDCSGTSTTTTVTMDTVKTCTATFELIAITSVKLVAITSPSPVCQGEEFDVTFQVVTAESQPVDGIQVYLNFDPDKMQINSIASSGVLDFTLMEEFDNAAGYINFAAGSWENEPPTGNFELVTINFTALEESEETLLQVDPDQSSSTFGGEYLPQEADDTPVTIEECNQLGCKVALQGRASPPDPSWETELKIYAEGNIYTINTDNEGHCQLPKELSEGDYSLCVKNSHTLANRIGPPVAVNGDDMIDFGTLLEGDVNDDNKVVMDDFTLLYQSKGKCEGEPGYNANANLNADKDNCVNTDDRDLLQANYFKPKGNEEPSICEWDNSVTPPILRSGVRDGGGAVTLRTAPIPSGLIAGTPFDVVVQVQANKQLAEGAAAYLNFDPEQLQVNHLTVGKTFDFVLQNEFDNTQGHINFAAGVWDNEVPKGLFTLVTINMTVLQADGEKTLSFNTTAPRQTEASSGGKSVISEQRGEVVIIAPASCQLYAVHDEKLNDSQFFTMRFDDFTISALGPMYKGHDIESLAIHPETNMIYAASGDNVTNGKKGHFYRVDGENGELFPVGSSGFKEIEDLAFSPDGILYAWAKGDGLITIDDLTTGEGTLVLAYDKPLIEGLTLKKDEGNVFFGAVGTDLWQYDGNTDTLDILCPNELLGETEALEITPEGLLLIGTHKVPFGLHAFDIQTCQVIEAETLSNQFNDVEGIALPVAACSK